MAGDKRYGSTAWKRTRRVVIARAGGICEIRGPRCTVVATTCDHIAPVAFGGAFFDPANLRAACAACNYGGGSRIRGDANRNRIEQLEQKVRDQRQELEHAYERIAGLEQAAAARPRRTPSIR